MHGDTAMGKHDLEAVLLDAARRSGLSMKQLAKRSGLGYQTIHGFVGGYRTNIAIRSASKLANTLGLQLTKRKGR